MLGVRGAPSFNVPAARPMASLHFDTAGADSMSPALAIPCLPVETARRVYDELSSALR